jgi:acetylornithine deacetylase/succinyl-diaminopimelate desuccinylase family protein
MSVIEEIKKLIAIPSVTGEEALIGKYLYERFTNMGCITRLIEVEKERFNIFAVLPGTKKNDLGLIFHGHIDTIPAYNMKSPFTPIAKDNHIWGRGSVDQKGGIASVISAFEKIVSSKRSLKYGVGFIGVVDEESEHKGSMNLKDIGIKAKYAVVTEPTGLKLGIGCKGTAPIKITIKGKASHGCRPWLGVNAIEYGMKIVSELLVEDLPIYKVRDIDEVKATLNLGLIRGGVAYNIVPDECVFWFDRRLIPGENQFQILDNIKKEVKKFEDCHNISAVVEIARPDWNWEPIKKRGLKPALTDIDSEVIQVVKVSHREVIGDNPTLFFTDGYNEMDFLINDLGIPTVQYGPGDSGLCHTDEENIEINQLIKASLVYMKIIKNLCEDYNEN